MAISNLPPPEAARVERERQRRADLASPDPVTRYHAREQAMQEGLSELGNALAKQAENNAEELRRQERERERNERQNPKYKPLPSGAKITKD